MAQQFQGKDFWSDIFDETSNPPFQQQQQQHQQETSHKTNSGPQYNPVPQPTTDLYQTPSDWIIVIDLPGINKSDIQLLCARHVLTIKGEARNLFPDAEMMHSERLNGQFERTINLPENIEGVKPIATFRDGLLIVRIARTPSKTFQIDIE